MAAVTSYENTFTHVAKSYTNLLEQKKAFT